MRMAVLLSQPVAWQMLSLNLFPGNKIRFLKLGWFPHQCKVSAKGQPVVCGVDFSCLPLVWDTGHQRCSAKERDPVSTRTPQTSGKFQSYGDSMCFLPSPESAFIGIVLLWWSVRLWKFVTSKVTVTSETQRDVVRLAMELVQGRLRDGT